MQHKGIWRYYDPLHVWWIILNQWCVCVHSVVQDVVTALTKFMAKLDGIIRNERMCQDVLTVVSKISFFHALFYIRFRPFDVSPIIANRRRASGQKWTLGMTIDQFLPCVTINNVCHPWRNSQLIPNADQLSAEHSVPSTLRQKRNDAVGAARWSCEKGHYFFQ